MHLSTAKNTLRAHFVVFRPLPFGVIHLPEERLKEPMDDRASEYFQMRENLFAMPRNSGIIETA